MVNCTMYAEPGMPMVRVTKRDLSFLLVGVALTLGIGLAVHWLGEDREYLYPQMTVEKFRLSWNSWKDEAARRPVLTRQMTRRQFDESWVRLEEYEQSMHASEQILAALKAFEHDMAFDHPDQERQTDAEIDARLRSWRVLIMCPKQYSERHELPSDLDSAYIAARVKSGKILMFRIGPKARRYWVPPRVGALRDYASVELPCAAKDLLYDFRYVR